MKHKLIAWFVLVAIFLVGCSENGMDTASEQVPDAEAESDQSEFEAIDPLEEAATISTLDEPDPPLAGATADQDASPQEHTSVVQGLDASLPPDDPDDEERGRNETVPVLGSSSRQTLGSAGVDSQNDANVASVDIEKIEMQLFQLVNQERENNNLEPLGLEPSLQQTARIRAQEALESLSHNRPDGTPYYTAFDEAGFPYAGKWHGENMALIHIEQENYDESQVVQAVFDEWVKSPGHCLNIQGDSFYQTGVGIYMEPYGQGVVIGSAQMFAGL